MQSRHNDRVADDADFNFFRAWSEKAKENSDRTHVSLKEQTRIAEKEKNDAWQLALENKLRTSKGKEIATDLDELEEWREAEQKEKDDLAEVQKAAAKKATEAGEDVVIQEVEDDAFLQEAGRVLMDLIGLTMQIAGLESIPPEMSANTNNLPVQAQATEGG